VGRGQKLVLHSAAEESEDWICTHVTRRVSYVGEKKEKVEEALAKSEIRGGGLYKRENREKNVC
jgi:hypothetical protein